MIMTVERQPNCIATLSVEIPAEVVNAEREKILKSYAKKAKIPGFRPGKVPHKVIGKHYNKEITEEIESELVNRGLHESLIQEKLKVLDFGVPCEIGVRSDGTFGFQTILTLAPELVLPEYKNIPVTVAPEEVTSEEVEAQIELIRARFVEYLTVTDRAIAIGDIGVIDFYTTIDGVMLEEALGKPAGYLSGRKDFRIRMADDVFLPGFASQLVGADVGSEREIDILIPNEFPIASIVGKTLHLHVKLKEIKRAVFPVVDDAFAAKLMGDGFTSEDFRSSVRLGIKTKKQNKNTDQKIDQIITHLSEQVDFEIPEALLYAEAQRQTDEMVYSASKKGMSDEEIMEKQEEFFATAEYAARDNIKANFILQEIAEKEGIHVDDVELISHVIAMAEERQIEPDKFYNSLKRGGRLSGIRNSLLVNKVLAYLLEEALVFSASNTETISS
jgi:trigger factor